MFYQMKYKISLFLLLIFVLNSCQNDDERRLAENAREAKKNEKIFNNINKAWVFIDEPINEVSEKNAASWNEWREFLKELGEKPRKTIGAFQKKSTAISKKALALNNNIPAEFNQPQIKSRISILITKVKMMDLFIHLSTIPDEKVTFLIGEINKELVSLERQMDKIVEKNKIPKEEGEADFLRMLDTTRAIPNQVKDPNLSIN
jgi:membrane-bound lytic murein transglycosylase